VKKSRVRLCHFVSRQHAKTPTLSLMRISQRCFVSSVKALLHLKSELCRLEEPPVATKVAPMDGL